MSVTVRPCPTSRTTVKSRVRPLQSKSTVRKHRSDTVRRTIRPTLLWCNWSKETKDVGVRSPYLFVHLFITITTQHRESCALSRSRHRTVSVTLVYLQCHRRLLYKKPYNLKSFMDLKPNCSHSLL